MKFSPIFFLAIFFVVGQVFAAEPNSQEEIICKTSPACKKVCDYRIIDKFEEITPEQKNLVMQCAQDISKKFKLEPKKSSNK